MRWTPASGARQLRRDFPDILDVLCNILTGAVPACELARDPTMIPVLRGIGGNTALTLLQDPSGRRLAHWPRAWAARTLALIGDSSCAGALARGGRDDHWRVRMQSMRAAGLVTDSTAVDRMVDALASDPHLRVREAVARAIGRSGSEQCLIHLSRLTDDADIRVRQAAERAISRAQARFDR